MFLTCLMFSFVLSLACTGWLIAYLSEELLDIPNQRSSHSKPVLRGGGIGFVIAFAITGLIAVIADIPYPGIDWTNYVHLWLVLTPLVIIGFIDDRQDIAASIRYLVQLLSAAAAIFYFGTIPLPGISHLGAIGSVIAVIFSIIAITALINFYNFMDGLDGLVASIVTVQLGFIALYLQQPLFLFLAVALVGFLWWNWSPAKIFMGDVGSTFLGAAVAIALLSGRQEIIPAWSALSVTFPLIGDSIYTIIRRLLNKENIFQPHRTHIYQRLQQSGFSHDRVAMMYIFMTVVSACVVSWLGIAGLPVNLLLALVAIAIAETYLARKSVKA